MQGKNLGTSIFFFRYFRYFSDYGNYYLSNEDNIFGGTGRKFRMEVGGNVVEVRTCGRDVDRVCVEVVGNVTEVTRACWAAPSRMVVLGAVAAFPSAPLPCRGQVFLGTESDVAVVVLVVVSVLLALLVGTVPPAVEEDEVEVVFVFVWLFLDWEFVEGVVKRVVIG